MSLKSLFQMLLCVGILTAYVYDVSAQCTQKPVTLQKRLQSANLVVEGKVLSKSCFFNDQQTLIYTSNIIEVYKVFKGHLPAPSGPDQIKGQSQTIEVITLGGTIANRMHVIEPSLKLQTNSVGVFILKRYALKGVTGGTTNKKVTGRYEAIASNQGFVKYNLAQKSASDIYHAYPLVPVDLYSNIQGITGQSYQELKSFNIYTVGNPTSGNRAPPAISGFTPDTVPGGNFDTLTINGTDFGTQGPNSNVGFMNADDDGATYFYGDVEHITSWSNTQIKVLVPNRVSAGVTAGTGPIRVRHDDLTEGAFTTDSVKIPWTTSNILSGGVLNTQSFVETNCHGGYTYLCSNSTANNGVSFRDDAPALARFISALSNWQCNVGWNATIDTSRTTSLQDPIDDGIDIVSYDHDGNVLPGGVLGRASTFFSNCGAGTWNIVGIDIRFKRDGTDGVDWYYGSNPLSIGGSEDDFESVALHELGHNVQLGHIRALNKSAVMHYALTSGTTSRVLKNSGIVKDIDGGNFTVDTSAIFSACSKTGMTEIDCSAAPTAGFKADKTVICGSSGTIQFIDESTNAPTSWSWNFGDGSSSLSQSPSHNYTAKGCYTVTLGAVNGNGGDTLTKKGFILIHDAPTAASCDVDSVGHNPAFNVGITLVSLGDLHRTSGTSFTDPVFQSFVCTQGTGLIAGRDYTLKVNTGGTNPERVHVYIDWNKNGVMNDPGELVFNSPSTLGLVSTTVSVPCDAVKDTFLRMRVISDFPAISGPCENIDNGQCEEFTVKVSCDSLWWTGATDTDWGTENNWGDSVVPCECHTVLIPNPTVAPNQPVISTAGRKCYELVLDTGQGAELQVTGVGTLDIYKEDP